MADFDFARMRGVVPAVLQDSDSNAVLSVGYMNRVALAATLETGKVTLLSRRSGRLEVIEGATGSPAMVEEVRADGGQEPILIRVRIDGSSIDSEQGMSSRFSESLAILGTGQQD